MAHVEQNLLKRIRTNLIAEIQYFKQINTENNMDWHLVMENNAHIRKLEEQIDLMNLMLD